MRIGIFFGGRSREREVSFAGGRTVYDNLNKSLFTPVPIFVDSCGNFIQLDWQYVYKGTIRDFYPPANFIPDTDKNFQIYIESLQNLSEADWELLISQVGKQIEPKDFSKLIDFAFLTLHGPYGEDGSLQGLLEWYDISYSGSGILPSAIGISKTAQKQLFGRMGFDTPHWTVIKKSDYDQNSDKKALLNDLVAQLGLPMVFKAPHQGSSIGVSILEQNDVQAFELAIAKAFFQRKFNATEWISLTDDEKVFVIAQLADIREGLGMPLLADGNLLHHPQELFDTFEREFTGGIDSILLESPDAERTILAESFIEGKEFSCIVVEDENGDALALPPTQILKKSNFFDYKAKYLPGISRKITPIKVPTEQIQGIRKACEDLYKAMGGEVYARIDGFIQEDGKVFLNDPNTTSGMLPSSFFFHQAAEIGLNPSQFLTYIIRTSLACRMSGGKAAKAIASHLSDLDLRVSELQDQLHEKLKVAVIMGGFSSERHISVESGRNIYEKLASSTKYLPIPIFLSGKEDAHELHQIPVNILLKDNADDIYDKIHSFQADREHPVLLSIREEAGGLSSRYATKGSLALHKLSYASLSGNLRCGIYCPAWPTRRRRSGASRARKSWAPIQWLGCRKLPNHHQQIRNQPNIAQAWHFGGWPRISVPTRLGTRYCQSDCPIGGAISISDYCQASR
jgi:UDP-N-acetylmuramate--alanine ligase